MQKELKSFNMTSCFRFCRFLVCSREEVLSALWNTLTHSSLSVWGLLLIMSTPHVKMHPLTSPSPLHPCQTEPVSSPLMKPPLSRGHQAAEAPWTPQLLIKCFPFSSKPWDNQIRAKATAVSTNEAVADRPVCPREREDEGRARLTCCRNVWCVEAWAELQPCNSCGPDARSRFCF